MERDKPLLLRVERTTFSSFKILDLFKTQEAFQKKTKFDLDLLSLPLYINYI